MHSVKILITNTLNKRKNYIYKCHEAGGGYIEQYVYLGIFKFC